MHLCRLKFKNAINYLWLYSVPYVKNIYCEYPIYYMYIFLLVRIWHQNVLHSIIKIGIVKLCCCYFTGQQGAQLVEIQKWKELRNTDWLREHINCILQMTWQLLHKVQRPFVACICSSESFRKYFLLFLSPELFICIFLSLTKVAKCRNKAVETIR